MYFVKYGENYLHDPRVDECILFDLSLDGEENSCGYCDFTIYPTHPIYSKLRERDADNPIEVYDDDILLFSGFIYELGKEFYLDGHVKCKGELAYLSETIIRPYSTLQRGYGNQAPNTVNGYFAWLIEQHNEQTTANKQFVVGINQGAALDANNYLFRENDKYPDTLSELNEKLLGNDGVGGYLNIRHVDKTRYIDYLSEWTSTNTQILDFGKNLTDYTQTDDSDSIATYVIPLGAKMSETEYSYDDGYYVTSDTKVDSEKEYYILTDSGFSKCSNLTAFESGVTYYEYFENYDESNQSLTIEGLDDKQYDEEGYRKRGDLIYCESAVNKYGWVGVIYENTDIVQKELLIARGIIALKELVSPKRTIEIKAVDMHLVNPEIKPIRIGEYVRVRSKPHDLDSYFLCTNISLDLNNPENSLYTLGTTFDTLTGQQNKRIKSLNETINSTYEATAKLTEQEKQTARAAEEALRNLATVQEVADEAKKVAGSAVVEVHDEYAVSSDSSTPPTEGWSEASPEWSEGLFIWRRVISIYGDGTSEIGEPALLTGNSGSDGEDATVLYIESSRGTVFKNDNISTVLSIVIYHGSRRITDSATMKSVFGDSAYLQWKWQRIDEETFGVISSGDSRFGNDGFTFTLSPEDIDTKITFMCELII